jgi:hypothetical protein
MKSASLKFLLPLAFAGVASGSATFYNSAGFETPKFTTGNLDGQDGGIWIESGGAAAGTALVENVSADTGTQAVLVSRTASSAGGGDKRYWPNLAPITPTPAQNLVTVTWDMNVTATAITGVSTGPFFGIEAYDPNVHLIAAAGVDATTGEILFADPAFGGGFNNTAADTRVSLGVWNHFTLTMNFTTGTAQVYVNNTLDQTVPAFDSTGVTQFSDADLSTVATNVEPPTETGTALFDNYTVTSTAAVPEPASLAGLVIVAGLMGVGRDRQTHSRSKPSDRMLVGSRTI